MTKHLPTTRIVEPPRHVCSNAHATGCPTNQNKRELCSAPESVSWWHCSVCIRAREARGQFVTRYAGRSGE